MINTLKPLRIFRHHPAEGPGYLAEFLLRHGIPFQLVAIDQNEAVPASLDDISGLVFMGGPMSVNDPLPWITKELALIRRARERGMPVLGHCLGGQLISKALGGEVVSNSVKEIGWLPVERLENTAARDWLAELPDSFEVFHWHGERFTLPQDASLILKSAHCEQQGFVLDNILALQCHVEMTAPMVREWAEVHGHELARPSATVQDAATMTTDLDQRIKRLRHYADRLYRRWLRAIDALPADA